MAAVSTEGRVILPLVDISSPRMRGMPAASWGAGARVPSELPRVRAGIRQDRRAVEESQATGATAVDPSPGTAVRPPRMRTRGAHCVLKLYREKVLRVREGGQCDSEVIFADAF
jgi:hypothetical protein